MRLIKDKSKVIRCYITIHFISLASPPNHLNGKIFIFYCYRTLAFNFFRVVAIGARKGYTIKENVLYIIMRPLGSNQYTLLNVPQWVHLMEGFHFMIRFEIFTLLQYELNLHNNVWKSDQSICLMFWQKQQQKDLPLNSVLKQKNYWWKNLPSMKMGSGKPRKSLNTDSSTLH